MVCLWLQTVIITQVISRNKGAASSLLTVLGMCMTHSKINKWAKKKLWQLLQVDMILPVVYKDATDIHF